jgi:hypothetical protein
LVTTSSAASERRPAVDRLLGRDAQGHLLVVEGHDIDLQRHARDFLGLDRRHLADAVRRIDDRVANLELQTSLARHNRPFPVRAGRREGAVRNANRISIRRIAPSVGMMLGVKSGNGSPNLWPIPS